MAYSQEQRRKILDEIYRLMSVEGKTLREICRMQGMPSRGVIYEWTNESQEESDRYARAQVQMCYAIADEIKEIADTPVLGVTEESGTTKDGAYEKKKIGDMIEHRRLQIDARKFLLGKLAPTVFGDKVDVTSKGEKIQSAVVEVTFGDGGERSTTNNG